MKVVLFCGGEGMRLRGYSEDVPKPMVTIGARPVLWHVMKYYAHFGHKDFILCLGYKAGVIKNYFLEYEESVSNDFVFSQGGRKLDFMQRDIDDWKITFVDTGLRATIAFFRIHGAAVSKDHAVTRIAGRIFRRFKRTAPTA